MNTREKAKLVRNACVKAYNMDYDEFCAFFGEEGQHENYLKEKWQLMQRDFSRWFCGLDEESSEKFIAEL